MKAGIVILVVAALCGCAKKKSEDKAAAPPAAVEPQPVTGGARSGSALPEPEKQSATPADDGGELQKKMGGDDKKPQPADDGGEATKKACSKTEDCGANHDCCNGFCFKQGTAQHSIECKLPSGKL